MTKLYMCKQYHWILVDLVRHLEANVGKWLNRYWYQGRFHNTIKKNLGGPSVTCVLSGKLKPVISTTRPWQSKIRNNNNRNNDDKRNTKKKKKKNDNFREHSFFRRRGGGPEESLWALMHNLPALPLYFLLKNVTLHHEAVKFIVTHLFVLSNLCWPYLFGQAKS